MHHLLPRSFPRPRALLGAAALALAAGCAGARSGQAPLPAPDNTVRPGDRVSVKVLGEPRWGEGEALVDERGTITLTRVGELAVTGLDAGALRDTLRLRYARYLRNPDADVVVRRRVGVTGEVYKPSLYWVDVTTTAADLIALAGGVTEAGNANDVAIVRDGRRLPLPVRTMLTSPLPLQSGDQVVVGRRPWLYRNALAAASTFAVTVSVLVGIFRG